MWSRILPFFLCMLVSGWAFSQSGSQSRQRKNTYREVHFEDLIQRYFEKEQHPLNALEGIYAVSCVIVKKGRNLLTGMEQEKVVVRKENYARVAILRERPGEQHDFIEVSLSYREADKYPIMGAFTVLASGSGLIYEHTEPGGEVMSFSMTGDDDLIEGEYSQVVRGKTITYRLSYLRIFPKTTTNGIRALK